MKPAIHDASARQHSGGPSPVPGPCAVISVTASLEAEIAGLLDRSTQELRRCWRQLHRTGPPLGLSRDLLIRALAYQLQERAHGGASARPDAPQWLGQFSDPFGVVLAPDHGFSKGGVGVRSGRRNGIAVAARAAGRLP